MLALPILPEPEAPPESGSEYYSFSELFFRSLSVTIDPPTCLGGADIFGFAWLTPAGFVVLMAREDGPPISSTYPPPAPPLPEILPTKPIGICSSSMKQERYGSWTSSLSPSSAWPSSIALVASCISWFWSSASPTTNLGSSFSWKARSLSLSFSRSCRSATVGYNILKNLL